MFCLLLGYKYPVYGLQWHPEKSNFLWNMKYQGIAHDFAAIRVSQHFANFFISEGTVAYGLFK